MQRLSSKAFQAVVIVNVAAIIWMNSRVKYSHLCFLSPITTNTYGVSCVSWALDTDDIILVAQGLEMGGAVTGRASDEDTPCCGLKK
jgi:hypothetical protein